MSETKAESTTRVVGYFNPQKYSIFIEISEINLKAELAPNAYIRDRQGRFINDPIFEPYCHPKGLSRATSETPVPVNFVPRFVKSVRPTAAVTQARSFVRQGDGRTVPTYSTRQETPKETPANKFPITGMSMEAARKAGLVGRKTRLVDENYGADESTGAPLKSEALPEIKYSIESQPRIRTAAPLRPELTEADQDLPPEERSRRLQLQQSLTQASSAPTGDNFDPARVRPLSPSTPVALKAPDEPTAIVAEKVTPVAPLAKGKQKVLPIQPTPVAAQKVTPKHRIAAPVEPEPEPEIEAAPEETQVEQTEQVEQAQEVEAGSGIVQPLDESASQPPVMETPPVDEETGKRFICAADGRPFKHRSELERHVKRNYPDMLDQLMAPYPPS
jgi:hypothetical protein